MTIQPWNSAKNALNFLVMMSPVVDLVIIYCTGLTRFDWTNIYPPQMSTTTFVDSITCLKGRPKAGQPLSLLQRLLLWFDKPIMRKNNWSFRLTFSLNWSFKVIIYTIEIWWWLCLLLSSSSASTFAELSPSLRMSIYFRFIEFRNIPIFE